MSGAYNNNSNAGQSTRRPENWNTFCEFHERHTNTQMASFFILWWNETSWGSQRLKQINKEIPNSNLQ